MAAAVMHASGNRLRYFSGIFLHRVEAADSVKCPA